jgi:hypothetical protein
LSSTVTERISSASLTSSEGDCCAGEQNTTPTVKMDTAKTFPNLIIWLSAQNSLSHQILTTKLCFEKARPSSAFVFVG